MCIIILKIYANFIIVSTLEFYIQNDVVPRLPDRNPILRKNHLSILMFQHFPRAHYFVMQTGFSTDCH